ncbi:unnamed protein product [Prorocentrum cordatum]|uniref:Uncharacterized protein n=1 Tax=Prorocentrum cordatum TaxID=2364126 RepID=A0ABN9TFQ8_9DINO|nr:unnamed protein product [Polarella glacialis]
MGLHGTYRHSPDLTRISKRIEWWRRWPPNRPNRANKGQGSDIATFSLLSQAKGVALARGPAAVHSAPHAAPENPGAPQQDRGLSPARRGARAASRRPSRVRGRVDGGRAGPEGDARLRGLRPSFCAPASRAASPSTGCAAP